MGDPILLPGLGRLQHRRFQRLHHMASGRGRTPHLRFKTQTSKELAHRVHAHAALETKRIERGHHPTDSPTAACLRLPQPRLWMAASPCESLLETMHTAFGEPCLVGNPSHTLRAVVTKKVENSQAFSPKSHVSRFSER